VLAVEELHLRQMSQQRQELAPRLQAGMAYRQLVAPGSFLRRLAHTAAREGVTMIKVDPSHSTRACAVCGAVLPGQAGELYLTCPQGHRYDVDDNAAEILFRRAFAGADAHGTVGTRV
jgi:transposase